ncbi:hypothetical protein RUND412_000102 [Rhizina undulata]
MPSRLPSPVLSVDMNHIAKVDPSNVDNLFSMWTIFSKCAESLENGRRLENLSWRVWNRETFCCDDNNANVSSVPVRRIKRQDSDTYSDVPPLSSSVESATSEYEIPKETQSEAVTIKSRPCYIRRDSSERYRGKEKHMTPVHLVKLMEDLDKKSNTEQWFSRKNVTSAATQTSVPKSTVSEPTAVPQQVSTSAHGSPADSDLSQASERSTHSVVRGFSPGQISSSYRSTAHLAPQQEESSPVKPAPQKKANKKMFILGSSSESEEGMEDYQSHQSHRKSKLSEGLRRPNGEKRTSFRDQVATRTVYDDDAFTEDDEAISESAIDDEDSSDWESSDDSARSSYDERNMFRRVESRPQLASRRSLLSTMLHQPDRAAALANAGLRSTPVRSRTTSPSGPSLATSPRHDSPLAAKATAEITRSKPIIMTTSNMHPPALSPRTTRRNMLATELTESLRRCLLWERQQKNTTSAALKRRHTTHDVTKLVDYPQASNGHGKRDCASKNNSWNHFFNQGLHEYHVAGW